MHIQKAFLLNESGGYEPLVDLGKKRSCHTLDIYSPWSTAGWELLVAFSQNKKFYIKTLHRISVDKLVQNNAIVELKVRHLKQ